MLLSADAQSMKTSWYITSLSIKSMEWSCVCKTTCHNSQPSRSCPEVMINRQSTCAVRGKSVALEQHPDEFPKTRMVWFATSKNGSSLHNQRSRNLPVSMAQTKPLPVAPTVTSPVKHHACFNRSADPICLQLPACHDVICKRWQGSNKCPTVGEKKTRASVQKGVLRSRWTVTDGIFGHKGIYRLSVDFSTSF